MTAASSSSAVAVLLIITSLIRMYHFWHLCSIASSVGRGEEGYSRVPLIRFELKQKKNVCHTTKVHTIQTFRSFFIFSSLLLNHLFANELTIQHIRILFLHFLTTGSDFYRSIYDCCRYFRWTLWIWFALFCSVLFRSLLWPYNLGKCVPIYFMLERKTTRTHQRQQLIKKY